MEMIAVSLGLPCVFLRFNPDCWKMNKIKQVVSWEKRLNTLLGRIRYWHSILPEIMLTVEYMFYDEKATEVMATSIIDEDFVADEEKEPQEETSDEDTDAEADEDTDAEADEDTDAEADENMTEEDL